ncbi:barstar family protein [Actinomycetospora termitidis]|uniref:Barstar family protein n=1 Tax=Actinomycetospora termitidis TaxID=3053470 RepID=A0ABT7MEF4_9PSEU|nr:barstar family protein [Actinomycetospora sp. Odt1-22]MDL5157753.1 barstar family protein [Actinomycetospora sp. Odt1-22]
MTDLSLARTRARERARTVGIVAEAADEQTTLAAIGRALRFPDYHATSIDALAESVRDLSWLPVGPVELIWADGPLRDADPRTHRLIQEILHGASGTEGERPFRVTRVS